MGRGWGEGLKNRAFGEEFREYLQESPNILLQDLSQGRGCCQSLSLSGGSLLPYFLGGLNQSFGSGIYPWQVEMGHVRIFNKTSEDGDQSQVPQQERQSFSYRIMD